MKKSEMSEAHLTSRALFVKTLDAAGWKPSSVFNEQFDQGLWTSPEASMEYENPTMTLRFDLKYDEPRAILYLDSTEGKSLGLVFKCIDQLKLLLDAVTQIQKSISPDTIKENSQTLHDACPEMFKISASGDKLIPVKSRKSR